MAKKTGKTIVISIGNRLIAWTDGVISGDKELVEAAKELSLLQFSVWLYERDGPLTANLDDPEDRVGAVAAMMGISVGQAMILEIDDETYEALGLRPAETYEDILRIQGESPDE
jgi:hypothetical protein